MTIKTISLRIRKPNAVDKSLLQSLPAELGEITFDLPRLLKTTGVWEALPKRQRRHLRRLAPRLVTVVRQAQPARRYPITGNRCRSGRERQSAEAICDPLHDEEITCSMKK